MRERREREKERKGDKAKATQEAVRVRMDGGGGWGREEEEEEMQMRRRRRGSEMRTGWNYANQKTGKTDAWGGRARRDVKSDRVRGRCDEIRKEKEKEKNGNATEVPVEGKKKKISSSLLRQRCSNTELVNMSCVAVMCKDLFVILNKKNC